MTAIRRGMFYASFLGDGVRFSSHPASKQSIMALVGAGFGVTLAVKSQSEVAFPGVVYKPIGEDDAWVQVELAWLPTTRGRGGRPLRRLPARRGALTQVALIWCGAAWRRRGRSP